MLLQFVMKPPKLTVIVYKFVVRDITYVRPSIHPSIYGSIVLVDFGRFFSFLTYTQSVGLLGRGTSPSQGRYLHTEQHRNEINAREHPCLEWDWNPRFQCSRGRIWFMPQTIWPL
jgi:hypothetical protein